MGESVSTSDPAPVVVRVAAYLVSAQGVGVAVLAVAIVASGLRNGASLGQLFAQGVYYLILGAGMVALGAALRRGARWARTPTIVTQLLLLAVGYWMAVPSARPLVGAAMILLALATAGLLVLKPASQWANRYVLNDPLPPPAQRPPGPTPRR